MSTPEIQREIREALRRAGNIANIGFRATESCVELGLVLNRLGADRDEAIAKAQDMVDVIAREIQSSRIPLRVRA